MSKLVKQRKESIQSFLSGGRNDLADAEQEECRYIMSYLPQQLSRDEIDKIAGEAIAKVGATSVKDTGKVIAILRPILQGKADLSEVSEIVKSKLSNR